MRADAFRADIWAITSYFNPAGFATRYANYRVFRERIGIPLLSVELVYGDAPQLTAPDADRLVQLAGKDVLWQKERLLNVALRSLPASCRFVVWLDCDVVFRNPQWAAETREMLGRVPLVQPYRRVLDLDARTSAEGTWAGPDELDGSAVVLERESMASQFCRGAIDFGSTSSSMLDEHSPGHAWAARRDLLERVGFYDAMVMGSGDLVMAMAAIGRQGNVSGPFRMNPRQAGHYTAWAERYHEVTGGRMGVIGGTLLHLWHGDLADRGYDVRYEGLVPHGFDPLSDIAIDDSGCWRWSSDKPAMHAYVREYFWRRREDG
ncbi:MAG: hypothetical protein JSV95_01070 [Gemmatimonadota bacterium]|nr:MAG: hypothetical protein JSV95_01070 [Gemmatimonadota bacterium]